MKILKIIGYPHAGNDVFNILALHKDEEIECVLKIERHLDANFEREVSIINQLNHSSLKIPQIICSGIIEDRNFLVIQFEEGLRLSKILQSTPELDRLNESLKYMSRFGENLGIIHKMNGKFPKVQQRKFHEPLTESDRGTLFDSKTLKWLNENCPLEKSQCFVHGDHHYANVLWKDNQISITLDWELSGIGWKEFDIAWALIVRPDQSFMKTSYEINEFLIGYKLHSDYSIKDLTYCMVMIYQHFHKIGLEIEDKEYVDFIENEISLLINGRKMHIS